MRDEFSFLITPYDFTSRGVIDGNGNLEGLSKINISIKEMSGELEETLKGTCELLRYPHLNNSQIVTEKKEMSS